MNVYVHENSYICVTDNERVKLLAFPVKKTSARIYFYKIIGTHTEIIEYKSKIEWNINLIECK